MILTHELISESRGTADAGKWPTSDAPRRPIVDPPLSVRQKIPVLRGPRKSVVQFNCGFSARFSRMATVIVTPAAPSVCVDARGSLLR